MDRSKYLFHLLVCLLIVSNFCKALDELEAWNEFKSKFGKNYSDPGEEERRLKVFKENLEYVESQNTKSGRSFSLGINHLSDLTTEEINRSYNGFRLVSRPEETNLDGLLETLLLELNSTASSSQSRPLNGTANKSWIEDLFSKPRLDWREEGRVSRVKDQGSCGSCWAFATVAALESILARQGRPVLLSEQNLVDCSRSYGNYGCSGGLMDAALRYVHDYGVMASQDYPYTAKDERCKFIRSKSVIRARGSVLLPYGNEALLRLALSITGPIPVAIDAGHRSFQSYKRGIYDDTSCSSSPASLNHAVTLIGYGTDKTYGDYWTIKNSWSTKWGENGFMRMARNRRNLCGIASYAVLPIA